jgi:Zn-dependent protease
MRRPQLRGLSSSIVVLLKASKIVSVLKLAKFTKILVTASSMLLSLLAYGWAFGPWFGVGLIAMLFVHEMGHVIAMRRQGLPTALPVFIPFLGAAIFQPNLGDRHMEAYIGYGGPLLGTIGALLCLGLWLITGSSLLLVIAFLGIYLNLFNMIPIRPLDGGRIVQVLGRNVNYVGMSLLMLYTFVIQEPALLLIWVLVLQDFEWPIWWKSIAATILTVLMPIGFMLWDSHQPPAIDALDCFVAFLFTALYIATDRHRWRRRAHGLSDILTADPRPFPVASIRFQWLAIYLVSVLVLWGCMWYLIEQLPQPH